jgi:indole-3-glycerol phosphate synthase
MTGLLKRILTSKRIEIEELRKNAPGRATRDTLDVVGALAHRGELRLMAEVKHKSPSGGELSRALTAGQRAVAYARSGAAMVSVLCDEPFFGGSYADLALARRSLDDARLAVPLLAKEFIVDAVQLSYARHAGADAALLIARIVPDLGALVAACRLLALEPFVEVASTSELVRALDAGARVIGINARDLDTLVVDRIIANHIVDKVPPDRVAVHLSGLRTPEDVADVARGRADAALVGEALMRQDDPSELLKRLLAATGK